MKIELISRNDFVNLSEKEQIEYINKFGRAYSGDRKSWIIKRGSKYFDCHDFEVWGKDAEPVTDFLEYADHINENVSHLYC